MTATIAKPDTAADVPNLDCMPLSELQAWIAHVATTQPIENVALELFGGACGRQVYAVRQLLTYARTKKLAMHFRLNGDIADALREEAECERIYGALPDFARW